MQRAGFQGSGVHRLEGFYCVYRIHGGLGVLGL